MITEMKPMVETIIDKNYIPKTWVNSSPSSNFAAQTITINTTDISYVYILQRYSTSDVAQSLGVIDVRSGATAATVNTRSGGTAARTYTVTASGIQISVPLWSDPNSYAIPLMILTV